MKRIVVLLLVGIFVALSCSKKLEGPSKVTIEPGQALEYCGSIAQGFILRGSDFSPMVENGAEENPKLAMPQVCLTPEAGVELKCSGGTIKNGACCLNNNDVQWVSKKEIQFTLRKSLGLSPGTYHVTVTNPDGTKASGDATIVVKSGGPIIFWADPSTVYNGITTRITLFGSNLGSIDQVVIKDSSNPEAQEIELPGLQLIGTLENRIQVNVPQGTAAGTYDITARKKGGCETTLFKGLKIVDQTGLQLSSIDPSFGWKDADTSVQITGTGFVPAPRAYLNPVNADANTPASGINSVVMVRDNTLTGVVPKGLPVGDYKLIVVNGDGNVGVLDAPLFKVTDLAPPVVDNISPSYLDNGGVKTLTIDGSNFRNPTIVATCHSSTGFETILTGTTDTASVTGTTFNATLDTSSLEAGTVCVVRVTNDDGSYYDYSAIGVSNPSLNLSAFLLSDAKMAESRRAPAVIAGRATNSQRYIYAIGGDDGSTAGAKRTVESIPIDLFGVPGTWFTQQVQLPAARTLSAVVRIGRFFYLAGGNDGTAPVASMLRAQVLDPAAAPKIEDVTVRSGCPAGKAWDVNTEDCVDNAAGVAEGIGAGLWYYRVSAVMADTDPSNPGGETLPSDPLNINLSDEALQGGTVVITLIWKAVPGAKQYYIYRNATGDQLPGSEVLFAVVEGGDTTTYEDKAVAGPPSGAPPIGKPYLPLGSTGVWMGLPDMSTAREALGLAAGVDPGDPNLWHIYAIAGRSGGALKSVDHYTATLDPALGTQTVALGAGVPDISVARSELSGYSVTHAEAIQVAPGITWIYAGGGAGSDNIDAAQVTAGGALTWSVPSTMSPNQAGYGGVAGAEWLYAFGGQQGGPGDKVDSGRIQIPPALDNWQPQGGTQLNVPRYLTGGTVESAFIFVVGGNTTGNVPTDAIERTVL